MKLRIALLCAAVFLTACRFSFGENVTSSRKLHQNVRQSYALNSNATVTIENVAGAIDVTAWNKPQIEIAIDKYGEVQSDLDNTNVVIDRSDSDFSAKSEYRSNARGGLVEYHVHVPSTVKLTVRNISGPITVAGVSGALSVKEVSGPIRATGLANDATVDSVSGNIELSFTKLGQGQAVTVKGVSGHIRIEAPDSTSATLTAGTVAGPVASQFPSVHIDRGNAGMKADGAIGKGEATLKLNTVSGSIDIDKAH